MNIKPIDSVLITGGTGFFGRAMIKHLLKQTAVSRICILSRDEAKQAVLRTLTDDPDNRLRWFLGDVRDQPRLRRAFDGVDTVIHAAALKRVEVGEKNPMEMAKTNVIGAMNVIEAAMDAGVTRVVALSTDKACHPINAYGASKLMAEKLFIAANNTRGKNGPRFAVTRYGNVAGSTGSVIPTWRAALNAGRVINITDRNATRFWMTERQAVELVWDACKYIEIRKQLIVPTLPAYKLGDLFAAVIKNTVPRLATLECLEIGLQPGEKMHEQMDENGLTSEQVERMTIDDLRNQLEEIL